MEKRFVSVPTKIALAKKYIMLTKRLKGHRSIMHMHQYSDSAATYVSLWIIITPSSVILSMFGDFKWQMATLGQTADPILIPQ